MYVVSARIKRAVEAFSKRLGIPTSYVFGVDVYFKKRKAVLWLRRKLSDDLLTGETRNN